jgi:predicted membrane channel-forming protein YqfA (hemolysin III family)
MNFWQIVMLMAWLVLFAVFIWAMIAVFIDVVNRADVSGVGTVGWIVLVLLIPIIGMLLYVWKRPKLTAHERRDIEAYKASVVRGGTVKAEQIATLARLRSEEEITGDEYLTLKAEVIGGLR